MPTVRFGLGTALTILFSALLVLACPAPAFALENGWVVVQKASAKVHREPSDSSPVVTRLAKGKRLQISGEERDGYLLLATKSGKPYWISKDDVAAAPPRVEEDLLTDETAPAGVQPRDVSAAADSGFSPRATFDLGFSTGSVGGKSYNEGNLGLNLYFLRYLAWRNAVFVRFASELDTVYGLDSSVRGILSGDVGIGGATVFAGPGYRFVNEGKNVPFGEGGLVLRLAGFALGGGVKTFFNKMVDSRLENDTQYFIILSGGGSL